MEQEPRPQGILALQVSGQNPSTWERLRSRLLESLEQVLCSIIDLENGTTVRDEAKKFSADLIAHCRARLERAGLENEKIEAEVRKIYAECESIAAETRRRHAEADALEVQNTIKKLQVFTLTKAVMIGEEGQEAIVFSSKIDAMLEHIKALQQSD